jgi:hypothetical protein
LYIGAFCLFVWLQHNMGAVFLVDFGGLFSWAPLSAALVVVFFLAAGPVLDLARQALPLVMGTVAGR